MRANEFIVKEDSVADKIGNWANKQVIDRKAIDRASVQKKNAPAIAKSLHEIIVAKANKLANNPEQLKKMAIATLSKALKINVTQHKEKFGDSVDKVITAMTGSPASIKSDGMLKLIQDVVTNSFKVGDEHVEHTIDDVINRIVKANEANEDLKGAMVKELKRFGMPLDEIHSLIEQLTVERTRTPDLRKALEIVLTDANPAAKAEPEAEPGEFVNDPFVPDEKAPNGASIEDIGKALKKWFMKSPRYAIGQPDNADDASNAIGKVLVDNGYEEGSDQLDAMKEFINKHIQADPDMPWNYKLPDKFTSEVFAPDGWSRGKAVYTEYDDKIHQYYIASAGSWRYLGVIINKTELEGIEVSMANTTDRAMLNFKHDTDDYYAISKRKSNR